jgi:hypothetical protein
VKFEQITTLDPIQESDELFIPVDALSPIHPIKVCPPSSRRYLLSRIVALPKGEEFLTFAKHKLIEHQEIPFYVDVVSNTNVDECTANTIYRNSLFEFVENALDKSGCRIIIPKASKNVCRVGWERKHFHTIVSKCLQNVVSHLK